MKKIIDWPTTLFLIISHFIGIVGTAVYVYFNGVHPIEILNFALFYALTGISITAGYHRYFAHRSYECHFLLSLFYLIFGACAYENSVLRWACDHRMHHKHVDTDLDPYNIKKGGWYAHIGWIFLNRSEQRNLEHVKDLEKDPLVLWQGKYYLLIAILVGSVLPFLIGLSIGRPWGGILWGGFFRVMFVHHTTFFINSLAHMIGRQTYTDQDSSRDSWWLAFLTYGEGYHNYHHKFQADYRNGVHWYQWDPTKWMIALGSWLNLTNRLNRTPSQKILSAKLEMEMLSVCKKAHWVPSELWERIQSHLEIYRHELESAHARWLELKLRYEKVKRSRMIQSGRVLLRWKHRLKIQERRFEHAKQRWRNVLLVCGHGTLKGIQSLEI
ncbi:MAG: fatty acid desaturase [Elusimicrobia bacterium]|nr:fatty acid desaturase [Elusimicrobiota bacterium]